MVLREEGVEEATALPRVGCPERSGVTCRRVSRRGQLV